MAQRPPGRTNTKVRMIRASADLFHKQGVHLTTPEEVVKVAGASMNQFYHHFANKEGLIHEVLQTYYDAIRDATGPVNSINYQISSWRDLEKWFFAHIKLQKRFLMGRGCPFGTIGNELIGQDGAVREDLSRIFELVKGRLAAFFAKEKSEGRLAKNAGAELLADYCIATIQGAMLLGKIKRDSKPAEETIRETLAHLEGYSMARNLHHRKRPERSHGRSAGRGIR
jgi:TetR/AcrR family transcriptional regulator, transcriptional repressor for nem operon